MEFRLLGPLVALDGNRDEVALGGRKPRAVLAMLLLDANRPVTPGQLAVGLWGDDAPPTALKTVHVHVSRLRKAIGGAVELQTTPAGYRLTADTDAIDVARFRRDAGAARRFHELGQFERAAELLRQALALWHGPPLADLAFEPFAGTAIAALEEERLGVVEARIAADLALGRHEALIAELQLLAGEHPTREGLTEQLMLALYRCGRQSEALDAYTALRSVLVGEFGVEPAPALRRIHDAVLRQENSLEALSTGGPETPDHTVGAAVTSESVAEPVGELQHDPVNTPIAVGTAAKQDDRVPLLKAPMPTMAPEAVDGAFVGREKSLELLRERWDGARQGRTALVIITGEPGIGKTRLATSFAEEVHGAGGTVLYGRADAEALLPYQPFAEALDHLIEHGGDPFADHVSPQLAILGRAFPRLRRYSRPTADDIDRDTLRYQIFEAVVSVVECAAEIRPLLLVLDDLHWADKLTPLLLGHLLRRADGARLLVVGTFRETDLPRDHHVSELMRNLRRERRYDRLALDGLDEQATTALVADRLGAAATDRFAHRLHHQTQGNAFLIKEFLALAKQESGRGAVLDEEALVRLRLPAEVADVILERARPPAISELAATVLAAASVVGSAFQLAIVEELVEASSDAVLMAIHEAIPVKLIRENPGDVGAFSFEHALVREVLYNGLKVAQRAQLHQRVAFALERSLERAQNNPAEIAHHFALARGIAGPNRARTYSLAAGRLAADQYAYEEAIKHFRRALDETDQDDEQGRCDVLLALGRVQWHAGDDGARDTFLAAAESAERREAATAERAGRLEAEAAESTMRLEDAAEHAKLLEAAAAAEKERRKAADQLARAALGLGERYFEVTYLGSLYGHILEKAVSAVGKKDSPRRALLLARQAVNVDFPNDSTVAHGLADDAVEMARGIGDDRLLAAVLIARHVTLLDVRHVDERLALGDELITLGDAHQELTAERHHWRMYDMLTVGDMAGARSEWGNLVALAARLGQPLFRSLAAGSSGLWAELAGDTVAAEELADESLRHARLAHTRDALSSWASQLYAMRRRQHRVGELGSLVEQLAGSGGHQLGWRSARGVLCFEIGDIAGARLAFDQELTKGAAGVPRGMFWLTRMALLSELTAMLAEPKTAEALYTEIVPYAALNVVVTYCSFWGPVDSYLAMLADTMGDPNLADRHLENALRRVSEIQAPLLERDLEQRWTARRG